jgi:hypothetical protein
MGRRITNSSSVVVANNISVTGNLETAGNVTDSQGNVRSDTYGIISSNTTLDDISRQYLILATTAISVTLPSSPSAGQFVIISDGGNFASSNCTVLRNGNTIGNLAENLIINVKGVSVTLLFRNGNWAIYANTPIEL